MGSYEEIELVQTCGACPEQYDAILNNQNVGYLRLRNGYFYTECNGKIVYESSTNGDGLFDEDEREFHLTEAKKAIYETITIINN